MTISRQPQQSVSKEFSLKALSHQMERLAALEVAIKGGKPDAAFLTQAQIASLGVFRLVVMGEIKKGKSSFINAVAGIRDLVPVHSDVATSTIYKIHYAPELRYTVYFKEAAGKEKLVISKEKLFKYGTEDGNPGNRLDVDFIRVEAPSPILNNGLIIVDTPGVGGLFKEHRGITFKHAPRADAVFFVTDCVEAPIGADEVSFLKELRSVTPKVYFVQTKACSVDADARAARMKNNLEILQRDAGIPKESINYFIVDSKMKLDGDESRSVDDLEDSGFGPLMLFLNNTLRKNQKREVGKLAMERSHAKLVACEAGLKSRNEVLDANTKEKMDQLAEEIGKQREQLKEWETETKPKLVAEFQKGLSAARRSALDRISEFRPGGPYDSRMQEKISGTKTAQELKILVDSISSDLPAVISKACLEMGEGIQGDVTKLLRKLATEAGTAESNRGDLCLSSESNRGVDVKTDALDRFAASQNTGIDGDQAMDGICGVGIGVSLGGMVGGIAGSIVPVVGNAAGAVIGSAIGGACVAAYRFMRSGQSHLKSGQREVANALSQTLASCYSEAQRAAERAIEEIKFAAEQALRGLVCDANDRLTSQSEDLQKRRQADQTEVSKNKLELATLAKEAQGIRSSLNSLVSSF